MVSDPILFHVCSKVYMTPSASRLHVTAVPWTCKGTLQGSNKHVESCGYIWHNSWICKHPNMLPKLYDHNTDSTLPHEIGKVWLRPLNCEQSFPLCLYEPLRPKQSNPWHCMNCVFIDCLLKNPSVMSEEIHLLLWTAWPPSNRSYQLFCAGGFCEPWKTLGQTLGIRWDCFWFKAMKVVRKVSAQQVNAEFWDHRSLVRTL